MKIEKQRIDDKQSIDDNTRMVLDKFYTKLSLVNLSKGTIDKYKNIIEKFFSSIELPLQKIKSDDVYGWLNTYVFGLKPWTVYKYFSALIKFFRYYCDNGHIEKVLIRQRRRPIIPMSQPKYLNDSEMTSVRIQAEKSSILHWALLEFLLCTGCRCAEAMGLEIKDLNLEERRATVNGRGMQRRGIYFTKQCSTILQKYLQQRNDNNPALFVNANGDRLKCTDAYRIIVKFGILSNLPYRFTPQVCRQTFAANLLLKGASLSIAADLLGYKSRYGIGVCARLLTLDLAT